MSEAASHVLQTRFDPPLNPDIEVTAIMPAEMTDVVAPAQVCARLAHEEPKHRLHQWRLVNRDGDQHADHENVIGAIVLVPQGNTSPIAAIDPDSRRVRTANGSVYELGIPAAAFAQSSPRTLQYLGFPATTIQAMRGQAKS